jgi:hypothetical protein
MVKQIDTLKCSVCGYYTANFLMKEGKCKYCFNSPSKQEITENKPTEENKKDDKSNV